MEYKELEKANSEIKKQDIKGKMYAPVSERVLAFRKVYPEGSITTEIIETTENTVTMKTTVKNEEKILGTGFASEIKKGLVNTTSMLENCETSAVGRALGMCGFGVESGIASEEEVKKAKELEQENKREEIYKNMFIPEYEAIKYVKLAIADLMRKQGVVKEDLAVEVKHQCWTSLENLNLEQLKMLEVQLSKINNKNHMWHKLYNQNEKIKTVVPENQEVIYKTSQYMFGIKALELAKDDEIKKNDIIDSYLEMGTDLRAKFE